MYICPFLFPAFSGHDYTHYSPQINKVAPADFAPPPPHDAVKKIQKELIKREAKLQVSSPPAFSNNVDRHLKATLFHLCKGGHHRPLPSVGLRKVRTRIHRPVSR